MKVTELPENVEVMDRRSEDYQICMKISSAIIGGIQATGLKQATVRHVVAGMVNALCRYCVAAGAEDDHVVNQVRLTLELMRSSSRDVC